MALSFWGWGGVYGLSKAWSMGQAWARSAELHACQGIGTALFANIETHRCLGGTGAGLGQPAATGDVGSAQARRRPARQLPNRTRTNAIAERQQALGARLSQDAITELGARYLFDGKTFCRACPKTRR